MNIHYDYLSGKIHISLKRKNPFLAANVNSAIAEYFGESERKRFSLFGPDKSISIYGSDIHKDHIVEYLNKSGIYVLNEKGGN